MTRKPCVMANWKMNMTLEEANKFLEALGRERFQWINVAICPPIYLCPSMKKVLSQMDSEIEIGAQNMYYEAKGAYTGEISGTMVKDAGCSYVILGHSERRHIFGESNEEVARRLTAAFANDLIPVICVGEKLEEREAGKTHEIISRQLQAVLPILIENEEKAFLIAYEPVWAIGTGKTATPDIAQEVQREIREIISSEIGKDIAERTLILYGGSVKPENAKELFSKDDVDGFLVGGASLKSDSFSQIIQYCQV